MPAARARSRPRARPGRGASTGGGNGSAELFAYDLPNGIVLPAFVTGSPIRGVYFGGQLPVAIDVEPGRDPNLIDLGFQREIPVAILGSGSLDAAAIDAATLSFGAGLAAPSGAASLEDENGDGRADLVARYRTGDTGIAFGDTEACASGRLLGGLPFTGCDAIRTPVRGTATGCGLGPELAAVLAALATARRRRRAAQGPRWMK